MAVLLRARGYLTAGFAGGALSSARYGVAQGFSHYRDPDGFQTKAQQLTSAVIEYLDFAGNAPIFLFVNYFDPHFPYRAPERFRRPISTSTPAMPNVQNVRVRGSFSLPPRRYSQCTRTSMWTQK